MEETPSEVPDQSATVAKQLEALSVEDDDDAGKKPPTAPSELCQICLPLHRDCDASLCEALKRRGDNVATTNPSPEFPVQTTLLKLRHAACESCRTCATIFTAAMASYGPVAKDEDQERFEVTLGYTGHGFLDTPYRTNFEIYVGEPESDDADAESDAEDREPDRERRLCNAFSVRPHSYPTGKNESFEQVAAWMEACKTHEHCHQEAEPALPTRVIYIGDNEDDPPRLIETEGRRGSYLALSHCWGMAYTATTTKETKAARMKGIPFYKLPKTFRDAINITGVLGYSYLWIDSLCIIQGDAEDWQRESGRMAEVYRHAALTIAASASENGLGGCFRDLSGRVPRDAWHVALAVPADGRDDSNARATGDMTGERAEAADRDVYWGRVHVTFEADGHWRCAMRRPADARFRAAAAPPPPGVYARTGRVDYHSHFSGLGGDTDPRPLARRAWALQEQLLATRVLHYTDEELLWECKTCSRCQCGAAGTPWDGCRSANDTFKTTFEEGLRDPDRGVSRGWLWDVVVGQFSGRALTFQRDRLPALSGLVKHLQRLSPWLGAYHAGMWEALLPDQLLWFPSPAGSFLRPQPYVGPTWSWVSVNARVSMTRKLAAEGDVRHLYGQEIVGTVVSVQSVPTGLDPTGPVSDALLTICAPVIPAVLVSRLSARIEEHLRIEHYEFYVVNDATESMVEFVPDSPHDVDVLSGEEDVLCALWKRRGDWDEELEKWEEEKTTVLVSQLLVLRASKRRPEYYERLGVLCFWEEDRNDPILDPWMAGAEERTLTVI